MTFLLDENFSTHAVELLEGLGHTAHDMRRIGMADVEDAAFPVAFEKIHPD